MDVQLWFFKIVIFRGMRAWKSSRKMSFLLKCHGVSNHPDLAVIIPILLENPESRRNFGRDRKIPILNPRSYFRQINKETKYLTWIWVKVKVWTKNSANKNPLPSVSGCIAFVQSLLRLVTSIELLHIQCVLLYPVSQKSVSTKWRVYKGKIWTWHVIKPAFYIY